MSSTRPKKTVAVPQVATVKVAPRGGAVTFSVHRYDLGAGCFHKERSPLKDTFVVPLDPTTHVKVVSGADRKALAEVTSKIVRSARESIRGVFVSIAREREALDPDSFKLSAFNRADGSSRSACERYADHTLYVGGDAERAALVGYIAGEKFLLADFREVAGSLCAAPSARLPRATVSVTLPDMSSHDEGTVQQSPPPRMVQDTEPDAS